MKVSFSVFLFLLVCPQLIAGSLENIRDYAKEVSSAYEAKFPSSFKRGFDIEGFCILIEGCYEPNANCDDFSTTQYIGKCDFSKGFNPVHCDSCPLGYVCSAATSQSDHACVSDNIGSDCESNNIFAAIGACVSDGIPTQDAQCINDTCSVLRTVGVGDSCEKGACFGSSNYCLNDICVGKGESTACESSIECGWGSSCQSGTCLTWKSIGQSCNKGDCEPFAVCSATVDGICMEIGTVEPNENCTSTPQCAEGLYCKDGECQPINSGQSCDPEGAACPDPNSICQCNFAKGANECINPEAQTQFCIVEQLTLASCMEDHQCRTPGTVDGYCSWKNCREEMKAFTLCLLENNTIFPLSLLDSSCNKDLLALLAAPESSSSLSSSKASRTAPFFLY